ncbi:MAG: trehalose-6-phosphate synthase [Syntrophobacterales bacterium]|nr:MAG: trehalose-6-phosphate synthase [Syntrophobacterales bacterium]
MVGYQLEMGGRLNQLRDFFTSRRLVVVSNRLPYNPSRTSGGIRYVKGSGGLVTALDPILRLSNGLWIGWDGGTGAPIKGRRVTISEPEGEGSYQLRFVDLTEKEISHYYYSFSNRTLWPLFHNFIGKSNFNSAHWKTYFKTNAYFAGTILEEANPSDIIWIQDYHLSLVPNFIRYQNPELSPYFFLHTPFPPYDTFRVLPWCKPILEGFLGSEKIGFHVKGYADNFLDCVQKILNVNVDRESGIIELEERNVKVGAHPISIDYDAFHDMALAKRVTKRVEKHRRRIGDRVIILGVDRLDYTKGIKERLLAVERFLEKHGKFRNRILFIQVAVPSRTRVDEYRIMKKEIDETIGRINGRFTGEGWPPIHYIYRSLSREELVAYYRLADIALITPGRDGMNLIAKEYIASQVDKDGVLVLSEFAGAADELTEALLVNPYDIQTVSETIYKAIRMSSREKRRRVEKMQDLGKRRDIYHWVRDFFGEIDQL